MKMYRTIFLWLTLGTPAVAQDMTELEMVKQVLSELQLVSIRENVEYCGVIGVTDAGSLATSPISRGDEGSCLVEDDGPVTTIFASFHTHGAFSLDYASEFPSVDDVEGDEAEGIDGYVATPGGRLWYIDTAEGIIISQICGVGCLPSDPAFIPGSDGEIAQSYNYDELVTALEN